MATPLNRRFVLFAAPPTPLTPNHCRPSDSKTEGTDVEMEDTPKIEIEKITLRLYRRDRRLTFTSALNQQIYGVKLIEIIASKDVLLNSSASSYFRPLLTGGFAESGNSIVDLEEENANAMVLWMKLLHNTAIDKKDNSVMSLSIVDFWHAVNIARFCNFELSLLIMFFNEWVYQTGGPELEKFLVDELRQLLFLSHEFSNAEAFAHVTRRLAYECDGHIEELNYSGHGNLRLDHRIIGAINAARGRLRTILQRKIYINRQFLRSNCSCKKEGLFAYELSLDMTRGWPLEEVLNGRNKAPIQTVLNRLRTFIYEPLENGCNFCSQDFGTAVVFPGVQETQDLFDGLCLDCIDGAGKRDWDHDYRTHAKGSRYKRTWTGNDKCRVKHGDCSAYHSWLARKEERNYHTKARDNRKRTHDDMELDY